MFVLRGCDGKCLLLVPGHGFEEVCYQEGHRDGVWRQWDFDGNLINKCEYREGHPWQGRCRIYEGKAFSAIYKQGELVKLCY